jgi:hypothetical protein
MCWSAALGGSCVTTNEAFTAELPLTLTGRARSIRRLAHKLAWSERVRTPVQLHPAQAVARTRGWLDHDWKTIN